MNDDFNVIRSVDERRSKGACSRKNDFSQFNQFVDDNMLPDLPLGGKNFTWYYGDGISMNLLDNFLFSEECCLVWPNFIQIALAQGLSDHCSILLMIDEDN